MSYRDSSYDRPLDNPLNWSFRVGRLFAIDIRVHILFVIALVVPSGRNMEPNSIGDIRRFVFILNVRVSSVSVCMA